MDDVFSVYTARTHVHNVQLLMLNCQCILLPSPVFEVEIEGIFEPAVKLYIHGTSVFIHFSFSHIFYQDEYFFK